MLIPYGYFAFAFVIVIGRRRDNELRSREILIEVDDLQFSREGGASSLAANLWTSTFQAAPTKLNPSAWPHGIPPGQP